MTRVVNLGSDDLYERLGLDQASTTEEIKRAYRALLRQYPPERAPEEFKRLREAYETLGNPSSREEYDRRPDPVVAQWLDGGLQAMKAEQHDVAERYFKQVLLQEPDLSFVRNLLGLCFLYQGEPAKAATQFERLLGQPDAPAAWFGNAGHAYRELKRYADAERAFKEAVRRATDSPVDYVIGLADLQLDQGATARAVKMLEDAIKADGVIDFQDLRYFTRLLEIHLREGDDRKVGKVLTRMKGIATDEDQRRYVAWKVGSIGQQLVVAHRFEAAVPLARLARALQPADPDYVALEQIGRLLYRNDFAGVGHLLKGHASFRAGEWLAALGGWARDYMVEHRVFAQMEPISAAPTLHTINGIGSKLYGERDRDAATESYVTTLYFVVLFVPLFPIACYRVTSVGDGRWRFLGKVPYSQREKRHWMAAAALLIGLVLWNVWRSDAEPYVPPASAAAASAVPSAPAAPLQPVATGTPAIDLAPADSGADSLPDFAALYSATKDDRWYAAERTRLRAMEARIEARDRQIAAMGEELESIKQRVRSIQDGSAAYSTSDPEYDRLLREYNDGVDVYNGMVAGRKALYGDYKLMLQYFNDQVDLHNASRRR